MLITTVVDEYSPMMDMSHGGCYGYVYGEHQTEISVWKAWRWVYDGLIENANAAPATGRGCLRASRRYRACSSCTRASASVRALWSNIGCVSRRCGHGTDGVVTVRMQVEWRRVRVPSGFESWNPVLGFLSGG